MLQVKLGNFDSIPFCSSACVDSPNTGRNTLQRKLTRSFWTAYTHSNVTVYFTWTDESATTGTFENDNWGNGWSCLSLHTKHDFTLVVLTKVIRIQYEEMRLTPLLLKY